MNIRSLCVCVCVFPVWDLSLAVSRGLFPVKNKFWYQLPFLYIFPLKCSGLNSYRWWPKWCAGFLIPHIRADPQYDIKLPKMKILLGFHASALWTYCLWITGRILICISKLDWNIIGLYWKVHVLLWERWEVVSSAPAIFMCWVHCQWLLFSGWSLCFPWKNMQVVYFHFEFLK